MRLTASSLLSNTARDQTNLNQATATERVGFAPTDNTTLSAALTVGVLKITPATSGLSLTMAGNLTTPSVLFTGSNDFTIKGTGALFGTGTGTNYIIVTDPNATLNTTVSLAGANHPINKSGAGFLSLTGSSNQLAFTAAENINLDQGTLRGTLTSLGGGTSAGGAFTTLNLFGGVLEISGGGNFSS